MGRWFGTVAAVLTLVGSTAAGASSAEAPIGELFQVILNVKDMGKQVEFWRDVMGFPIVYPSNFSEPARETFVRFQTGGAHLVLHAGREVPNARQEPRLSFMTKDLEKARQRLIAVGMTVGEVRSPAPGVLVVDCRDPEGNAFHLEARIALNE